MRQFNVIIKAFGLFKPIHPVMETAVSTCWRHVITSYLTGARCRDGRTRQNCLFDSIL